MFPKEKAGRLPPTPRRLADAVAQAHLSISHFFSSAISMLACLALAVAGAGWAVAKAVDALRMGMRGAFSVAPFKTRALDSWHGGVTMLLVIVGPMLVVAWGSMAFVTLVQSRGRLRWPQPLGAARGGTADRGRTLPVVIAVVLTAVAASCMFELAHQLARTGFAQQRNTSAYLLSYVGSSFRILLVRLSVALFLIACVDVAWQHRRWLVSLRMTRQEVQDEVRLLQGDPSIRKEQSRLGHS